ncbi:hypothetical protein [Sinorhizobium meliloti]|uniref:hypothetical protein n=1 Tax=Rhizobium meliloti TaxID=382 RepID=UPI0023809C35|nr:hypothetical protein [Sinorhizobium meliloti]MDE3819730.1 hypothetical protein [Sinorhizobium meliloti]
MEMLAASAISLVTPYLVKGSEEFAKGAGKAAFGAVEDLVRRLQEWWRGDPIAATAVGNLASEPQKYAEELARSLSKALANDAELAADLERLTNSAAPYAEIVQNIGFASGVTGADIKSFIEGRLKVVQHISKASNTTGLKVETFGKQK